MPLREVLEQVLSGYHDAPAAPLEGHPLAEFIRNDAKAAVKNALGELTVGRGAGGGWRVRLCRETGNRKPASQQATTKR